MAFESESTGLKAIYVEIRRRRAEVGRLSRVEFDDAEYATLRKWAQRIVQMGRADRYARTVFLAFACEFVRRTKYTSDNIFWAEFEATLGLERGEQHRFITDHLLWPAYGEEGIEQQYARVNRRIVGSLVDEVQNSRTWLAQARSQFIEFFQWYYRHYPGSEITPELFSAYREQTGSQLLILDKALPALTRDCQTLARIIDYTIENGLYLQASRLEDYRHHVMAALGADHDPTRLHLIRDRRTLINLILALQNHYTSSQFRSLLQQQREGFIITPWGKRLNIRNLLDHWTFFPYGIYRIEAQEYRVVPHPRLRLEMLDEWPYEQVVSWQSGRFLGYKKRSSFHVTIGRRTVEAMSYWLSRNEHVYVWAGPVPVGERLVIDGHLRPESAGPDWHIELKLIYPQGNRVALCIVIDRLVLYYPNRAHHPVRVWASTGYTYTDSLREDGVRRFHRHGALVIPLETFDAPVEVGVDVDNETVLHQIFEPELCYLFSIVNRARVQAREQAEAGDREYVLFSRVASPPKTSPGVSMLQLPGPYGAYTVYQVTWEDPNFPFNLRVGSAHWTFQRRREFVPLISSKFSSAHLRLKPHQFHSLADISLRLYSTLDLTAFPLKLEVWDDNGPLPPFDLGNYIQPTNTPNLYDVSEALWREIGHLTKEHWGHYTLRFLQDGTTLDTLHLALIPPVQIQDTEAVHPEKRPLPVAVTTSHPAWNPMMQQAETHVQLTVHPRTHAEPWPGHPGLRRIVSEPVSTPLIFPDLGESIEVVVQPRLFGLRLYLKHSKQTYQPVEQADYYHLAQTVLYIFSAPGKYVEITCGALVAWSGQTDTTGDLLIADLSFLRDACLNERTKFTVRSGGLKASFIVQWAPRIYDMDIKDGTLLVRFHGPSGTALRLHLRNDQGAVCRTWEIGCQGREANAALSLPPDATDLNYLTAEYVLSNGQIRPSTHQITLHKQAAWIIPSQWLIKGIGVDNLEEITVNAHNTF